MATKFVFDMLHVSTIMEESILKLILNYIFYCFIGHLLGTKIQKVLSFNTVIILNIHVGLYVITFAKDLLLMANQLVTSFNLLILINKLFNKF